MSDQRFIAGGELEALADAMPTGGTRVLTLLLGWTGLRFGEAAALRVDRSTSCIGDSTSPRLSPRFADRSSWERPRRTRPAPSPYPDSSSRSSVITSARSAWASFPERAGGPLRVTNWNRRTFTPAAKSAGLVPPKLRVHDLRHTAASLMVASGAGVKLVQSQLGHRTATLTLDRYAHLFPDELDALSGALDGLRERIRRILCGLPTVPVRSSRSELCLDLRFLVGRAGLEPATDGL